jgi:hypothetical protein
MDPLFSKKMPERTKGDQKGQNFATNNSNRYSGNNKFFGNNLNENPKNAYQYNYSKQMSMPGETKNSNYNFENNFYKENSNINNDSRVNFLEKEVQHLNKVN